MIRLLDEKSVIAPIRKLAKGCADLRIAVAFWGTDAAKTLSLTRARRGRILCNLESGACNPKEIRKLSMRPSWAGSVALAISNSLRAAASGSVKWLGLDEFHWLR
jgi:hypothetical protein